MNAWTMQTIENVGVVQVDQADQGFLANAFSCMGRSRLEYGSGCVLKPPKMILSIFIFYLDHLDHLDQARKINHFRGPGKKFKPGPPGPAR